MKTRAGNGRKVRNRCLMAMVLGTALSALGAAPAPAAQPSESTVRAVGDISRYCTACWRNARLPAHCWNDCTQEVFSRLLQRIHPHSWQQVLRGEGDERREFLRAIDAVKKRTQRGLKRSTNLAGIVPDPRDERERGLADEREAVARAAGQVLSGRQRQILELSFEGWAVQEIAEQMRLPSERVSDEKYKAIRKLRDVLAGEEGPAAA